MLLVLPPLLVLAVWFATASLRRKDKMSAGAQRVLLGLVLVLVIAMAFLQGLIVRRT